MHKALKLKRVADALAAAGGGWLPLTLKAWRKYVRRKRGKENARPALVVAKPAVALPPPPPVAEPPVLDTCAKLQPPSPPLSQVRGAARPAASKTPITRRVARRGRAARRALGAAPRGVGHLPPRAAPVLEDAAPFNVETQTHSVEALRLAQDAGRLLARGQDGAAGS